MPEHIPVLLDAVLDALQPGEPAVRRIVDGTLGAGGHTHALLEHGAEIVLGLDLDPTALAIARERLADFGERAIVRHASYADLPALLDELGWSHIDGMLLDLGISSMQVDNAERGFAFGQSGPLDMRFDPSGYRAPARDLINHWAADDLADIFYQYGEERHSRRIARAIVDARPLHTTDELAALVARTVPKSRDTRRIHPATRVFQALRIVVNDEFKVIERALPAAIHALRPGGRLAVISFHSLEDRIVKHVFKDASTEVKSPPGMVLEEKDALVRLITRKPITAREDEINRNRRSRSAKLRVVEKR